MKTKLFYLLAIIIVFAGCDKLKDAATIPVTTNLKADVPILIAAPGTKSVDMIGAVNALVFTKTQELTLAANEDIEPYISKIKEIDLNSLVVTVTGLTQGQTINSVSLDVTGVGNVFTQTNITMTNNTFTPVIASATLDAIATKLTNDKKITLTLSGNSSGPMTITISLNFGVTVTAYLL